MAMAKGAYELQEYFPTGSKYTSPSMHGLCGLVLLKDSTVVPTRPCLEKVYARLV